MDSGAVVFPDSVLTSSETFALALRTGSEGGCEMSLVGEKFESRSGSENMDGSDVQDVDDPRPRRRRQYHRHTPLQTQELESFFADCPHPNEKQRLELSRKLTLDAMQVKFWFQNRRTQLKAQVERHENKILKQENEKLQAENYTIKNGMQHPICNNCGGPAALEVPFDEHHLRIENARLKEELFRTMSLLDKLLGKSPHPHILNSSLDLAVGRNEIGIVSPLDNNNTSLPTRSDFGDGISGMDKSFLIDHALLAMNELITLVDSESPLWIKSLAGVKDVLNEEEYTRKFYPIKPKGFVTESSKETGMVNISSTALVEILMNVDQWAKVFPHLISSSSLIDVISGGMGGTKNGALQLMQAEFQILSPLVPIRKVRFLRFCKQHAEGVWAVVDVSFEPPNSNLFTRRFPSGCVVQDLPGGGGSKVTWVEHSEYDESVIHHLYRPLVRSGIGFGATRWISSMQRQCDYFATLLDPSLMVPGISSNGRDQVLNLSQRMMHTFRLGLCSSVVRNWDSIDSEKFGPDIKMMSRTGNYMNPHEPPRAVLSVATSVWIPVPHERVFDFLRNEQMRSKWDILSPGGQMHEMISIPKGREYNGSVVSILRPNHTNTNQSNILILQETWTDSQCSLVVYSPVEFLEIQAALNGRESEFVGILPSGFAVLPDGCSGPANGPNGSILTIGFQISVNGPATSNLTPESVQTVSNLISATLQKMRDALGCD